MRKYHFTTSGTGDIVSLDSVWRWVSCRMFKTFKTPITVKLKKQDNIYEAYSNDSGSRIQLQDRIGRWKTRWNMYEMKPTTLYKTLVLTNIEFYPYIATLLLTLLTMSASTAAAEWSFSAMHRVKNVGQDDNDNATLHIYREIEIDRQEVISIFTQQKTWKLDFI